MLENNPIDDFKCGKVDCTISTDGTKEWRVNGKLHREDGPAVIYPDGAEMWYQYGSLHRDDGPAIILPDGTKKWGFLGVTYADDAPHIRIRKAELAQKKIEDWTKEQKLCAKELMENLRGGIAASIQPLKKIRLHTQPKL